MVRWLSFLASWVFLGSSFVVTNAFLGATTVPQLYLPYSSHSAVRKMSESSDATTATVALLSPMLQPEETAFVFIEYQNEFTSPGGKLYDAVKDCLEHTNMLANSRAAVPAARAAGCTIIHCPISFEPGHHEIAKNPYGILAGVKEGGCFTAGDWGADFCEGMKPAPGDLVVKGKSGLCGFESTNLQFLLSQSGTKNVVLAGFLTNCCVESTMRAACKYCCMH